MYWKYNGKKGNGTSRGRNTNIKKNSSSRTMAVDAVIPPTKCNESPEYKQTHRHRAMYQYYKILVNKRKTIHSGGALSL